MGNEGTWTQPRRDDMTQAVFRDTASNTGSQPTVLPDSPIFSQLSAHKGHGGWMGGAEAVILAASPVIASVVTSFTSRHSRNARLLLVRLGDDVKIQTDIHVMLDSVYANDLLSSHYSHHAIHVMLGSASSKDRLILS